MAALDKITIEWDDADRPLITVQYVSGSAETSTKADTQTFLRDLAHFGISDDSAKYLRALIVANEAEGPTALADLASRMSVEKKKVEAWNRTLGKAVKSMVREYGFLRTDQEDGTAQIFDFVWDNDGNRWLYDVPKEFRDTLVKHLDER